MAESLGLALRQRLFGTAIIVRGYTEDGRYFEGRVLHIDTQSDISTKEVKAALLEEINKNLPNTNSNQTEFE